MGEAFKSLPLTERYRTHRLPADPWEVGAVEAWLTDRAREGWALEKCGTWFARFRREEPSPAVRIRCQLKGDTPEPDQDTRDIHARSGWYYAGRYMDWYWVWRCDDPAAPELYTDPVAHSFAYERRRTRGKWADRMLLIAIVVMTGWWLHMEFGGGRPVERLVTEFGYADLMYLVMWLYLLAQVFRMRRGLRRMEQTLAAGVPLEHDRDWRPLQRRSIAATTIYCLVVLSTLFIGFSFSLDSAWRTDSAPCPSYEQLTAGAGQEVEWAGTLDAGSVFAPQQWDVSVRCRGDHWLNAKCCRVRTEILAHALWREWLETKADPDARRWSVMDPRFDEAVVVERSSNGTSIFIGRVGELVVWQAANCGVDLADHLDLFAQAMVLE